MMHIVTLHYNSEPSPLHGVHEGAKLTFPEGVLPLSIRPLMAMLQSYIMNDANLAQPAASPLLQHYSTNNTADAEMSVPTTTSRL
jgi:hypothetical protein